MSLNRLQLIGYVGADPEIHTIPGGQTVANVSLGTTERGFTTRDGREIPDRTEWHALVFWGRSADVIGQYVKKGSQLYVEGKIRTRSWDENGIKRYKTECLVDNFELLDRKSTNDNGGSAVAAGTASRGSAQPAASPAPAPGNPDDLPF